MEKAKIKKGIHVVISHDAPNTDKSYQVIGSMRGMRGGIYKVEDVWINSVYGLSAKIKGYSWHAGDLTEVSIEKKSEPFHFNIKELSI